MDGFRLSVISDRRSVVIASYQTWRKRQGKYAMVKCKDCAMLGLLDSSGERVPFSKSSRRNGQYVDRHSRGKSVVDVYCWLRKREFAIKPNEIISAIDTEHDCDEFIDYVPGTTPKEVEEMLLRDNMAQLQRDMANFKRDGAESRKKLEDKLDSQFETREANLNSRFRWNLFYQFLFALLAAVVTLVAAKLLPFWEISK